MAKTKTIIYGGAFNPPTIAHEIILKVCIDEAKKIGAEVWIMPSGSRSDKRILSDRATRLKYIQAMIADADLDDENIKIITTELDKTETSNTYETDKELRYLYPDRTFVWLFGADSVKTMMDWEHGAWLWDNLFMLIINRPGYTLEKIPKNASVIDIELPDVSSTELRRRLSAGESIDNLVGRNVKKILI